MSKTILLTGATDGIGLETAKVLASLGHTLLLHGRNAEKLKQVSESLNSDTVESYIADLSKLKDVEAVAEAIISKHSSLDVLINNAGVFKTSEPITEDGLDVRFLVNTLAPYLLTKKLLPLMDGSSRVVNLSSAAQAPVSLQALRGEIHLSDDFQAYAQSKLAITSWSRSMGLELKGNGPMVVSVNPASYLDTKMVKDGFGMDGNDIGIGVDILRRAAFDDDFANASGLYFDNDAKRFNQPHPEALNEQQTQELIQVMDSMLEKLTA